MSESRTGVITGSELAREVASREINASHSGAAERKIERERERGRKERHPKHLSTRRIHRKSLCKVEVNQGKRRACNSFKEPAPAGREIKEVPYHFSFLSPSLSFRSLFSPADARRLNFNLFRYARVAKSEGPVTSGEIKKKEEEASPWKEFVRWRNVSP